MNRPPLANDRKLGAPIRIQLKWMGTHEICLNPCVKGGAKTERQSSIGDFGGLQGSNSLF